MKFRRALSGILLFASLATVAACASKEEQQAQEEHEEEAKDKQAQEAKRALDDYKPKLICPQVAILRELEKAEDYGDETPSPGDLVAIARMKGVEGSCAYQDDGIDISFKLNLTATKGPRLGGDQDEFSYFVAVIDPSQNILNKNQMTATFKFGSDPNSTQEVPMHIFIPLPKERHTEGPDYRVLAGFQLSSKQLDTVRTRSNARMKAKAQEAGALLSGKH